MKRSREKNWSKGRDTENELKLNGERTLSFMSYFAY